MFVGQLTSTKPYLYNEDSPEVTVKVPDLLKEAKETSSIEGKQAIYQKIFEMISPSQNVETYSLFLEQFVAETLYNQEIDGDDDAGFILSARIMEFSLMEQLKALGLIDQQHSPEISTLETKSLAEFVSRFKSVDPLDRFFLSCSFENQVMISAAQDKGFMEVLAKTLVRLSFSYQNCPGHNRDLELQELMQQWTEKALENDPVAQIEFQYNRVLFMLNLRNTTVSLTDKINAYQKVLGATVQDTAFCFRGVQKNKRIVVVRDEVSVIEEEHLISHTKHLVVQGGDHALKRKVKWFVNRELEEELVFDFEDESLDFKDSGLSATTYKS